MNIALKTLSLATFSATESATRSTWCAFALRRSNIFLMPGTKSGDFFALGLIAVIVARQPVLVTVDVEILRQAILDEDRFTPSVVIQEGFGQLVVNGRFDQPEWFKAP